MEPMTEGMNLDPTVLIAVQNERIAGASIREAQLTAAVQQLTMENMSQKEQIEGVLTRLAEYEVPESAVAEDEDASTDDRS